MVSFSVNTINKVDMSNLNLTPTTAIGKQFLTDYYLAAADGRWGENPQGNPDAYAFKALKNTNIKKCTSKNVPLITSEELDAGTVAGFCAEAPNMSRPDLYVHDIAENEVDESDYYERQMAQFIEMREYIFLEVGVDFASLLVQATRNNLRAIEEIKRLRKEFYLDDLIKDIVKCANWCARLEKLEQTPIIA